MSMNLPALFWVGVVMVGVVMSYVMVGVLAYVAFRLVCALWHSVGLS